MNENNNTAKAVKKSYVIISVLFLIVALAAAAIQGDKLQAGDNARLLEFSNNIAFWSVAAAMGYCLFALAGKAGKAITFTGLAGYALSVLLINSFTFDGTLMTKQLVYTALMAVAFVIAQKSFSKDVATLPPIIIISAYAGISVLLVYGFTGGHLLAAAITAISVFALIIIMRAVISESPILIDKSRVILAIIGAAVGIGMLIYSVNVFAVRGHAYDLDTVRAIKREFSSTAMVILSAANILGYILILFKARCGAVLSLLSSWHLLLMLLFTALSPTVFGAQGLYPFFSRLMCGIPAAMCSAVLFIPCKKRTDKNKGDAANETQYL